MAWVTPSNVAAGDAILASKWNQDVVANSISLPQGVLGVVSSTSAAGTSASHNVLQDEPHLGGLSITYGANRYMKVTVRVAPYCSGGLQKVEFTVLRGSTRVATWYMDTTALSTTISQPVTWSHTFAGPATGATETFKVQWRGMDANTAVNSYADATYVKQLVVEDAGEV